MKISNWVKKIIHPFLKKGASWYYSKPRIYNYKHISVVVQSTVFPPHFTISTKILLDYIDTLKLKHKRFLELGCGSGIIAVLAATKGAQVTASDINLIALEALEKNGVINKVTINTVASNLFAKLKVSDYDYIFINPPYYPKQPNSIKEEAWYCGENFEYFTNLFEQLSGKIDAPIEVFMILSDTCDLNRIKNIAHINNLAFVTIVEKIVAKEVNYIFKIIQNEA